MMDPVCSRGAATIQLLKPPSECTRARVSSWDALMALANLTPAPLPLPSPELLFDPGGKAASVELLSRRSLLAQGVELGIFCFQEGDKGY